MASFSRNSLNSNNLNVPHKDIGIESKTYDSVKINNYSTLNNSEGPSEINVGFNDWTNIETVDIESNIDKTEVNISSDTGAFGNNAQRNDQFGGNQGSLKYNTEEFLQDPVVREIVSKYYDDVDNEDLELLFAKMNSNGCGYISILNTIFREYADGRPFYDEFHEKFGFDIAQTNDDPDNLDYNYEYLFLDFYLYYAKTEEKYDTIEEVYGNIEDILTSGETGDLALSEDEIEQTGMTGMPFALEKGFPVFERYLAEKGLKINMKAYNRPTNWSEIIAPKLEEKTGINVTNTPGEKTSKMIDKYFDESNTHIIIAAEGFNLYSPVDIDENGVLDDIIYEDVGSHGMYVVATTSDPTKIVVSSWGREYVMDLDSIGSYLVFEYEDLVLARG